MQNEIDRKSRRKFIKGVMTSGFSMALMKSSTLATAMLMARPSYAMGGIKNVITVFIPGGAPVDRNNRSQFIPRNNTDPLPVTSAPLAAFRDQITFFNGAHITDVNGVLDSSGHGNTSKALGARGRANSYDVELERSLGVGSLFPALYFGARSAGRRTGSKRDRSEVNLFEDNPTVNFNRIFGGNTGNTSSIEDRQNQSVIDIQREELRALRGLLGVDERARLDSHLDSIESIEMRLQNAASFSSVCTNPVFNTGGFQYDRDNANFNVECDLQTDLAVLALSCNMTKVVSLALGNTGCQFTIPGLNHKGIYHESIHGAGRRENFVETRTALSERLAYLLRQLRDTNDMNGDSLLDSTLVVQVSDMGYGSAHRATNAPVILAGGGGRIRTGIVVDTDRQTNVLDTITEAAGLSIPNVGAGPIRNIIV